MKIETLFEIGDSVRPVDDRLYDNWGTGKVDEIGFIKTAQRADLFYYVRVKRHGGYRLRLIESEIARVPVASHSKRFVRKKK